MYKFKITRDGVLEHPVYTSLFVVVLAILLFMPIVRPPVMLSMLLVAGLVYLSMFFGAKFAIAVVPKSDASIAEAAKQETPEPAPAGEAAPPKRARSRSR